MLFGVDDTGKPSNIDVSEIRNLDAATITDKISKYTNSQFSGFEIHDCEKEGVELVALRIYESLSPLVFEKPGTYDIGDRKQKTAFSQGTIYFRHGAKSETAKSKDIDLIIQRNLEMIRSQWMSNIRKVMQAPSNYEVILAAPGLKSTESPLATPIRFSDSHDPNATLVQLPNPDETHPLRQKDVIKLVNTKRKSSDKINSFDIRCVRKVHGIENNQQYFYHANYSAPLYTYVFVDWLVEQSSLDADFFFKARQIYKQQTSSED